MARKSLGRSNGRNFGQDLSRGSKTISISGLIIAAVAAAGVGIGLHKHTASKATAPQTVNAPSVKPMRASPEASEVLTQLRNRYGSVSQRQTGSDPSTADSALSQSVSPSSGTPKRFAIAELLGETHKWTYCALCEQVRAIKAEF